MRRVNLWSMSLGGVSLFLMAMIGAADVIGAGFGRPVVGAYELIETFMVITIFLAVAAAQQQRAHISVDLVKQHLPLRVQAVLTLLGLIFSAGLFLMIAYFGWIATSSSLASGEIRQGQLGFPVWPARMALALGASLMVLQCAGEFVSLLQKLLTGRLDLEQSASPAEELRAQ